MPVQSYRDLEVWQRAVDLAVLTYRLTGPFPPEERFGLISQMRRAAVSIASNIAEGHGRAQRGEYLQHLSVARGSLQELDTQFVIALRLNYLTPEECGLHLELSTVVGKQLTRLRQSLRRSP